jgi:hypothetical protein
VKEDLGASDWRLSESDKAELEREFPVEGVQPSGKA